MEYNLSSYTVLISKTSPSNSVEVFASRLRFSRTGWPPAALSLAKEPPQLEIWGDEVVSALPGLWYMQLHSQAMWSHRPQVL